ncbi:hypothetical protein CIG75_19090 [Tumebacillus algifaecis]|uniref:DNA repair protein MmcB-related protein n=1 Tax=Tumebacillus algifaecis TaxID=1214604 RepID=A0A223D5F9_9BACL|nr:MmcB family DNA repair protein [Tumebacillus algifaecis]ASS76839.1 hypothetical protein CIG75_19090 [Tumebacillus algifaecis]
MSEKVRADQITHALQQRHREDLFITECKTGPTQITRDEKLLKFDALAIKKSWTQPCITGYEVKVDRQDFLRDEKWPGYMKHCHRFSFVCPHGLIQPEELPDDVGLIYYKPEKGTLYTKRKALYRNIVMSSDMLYYILLSRTESDRHPFFSTQREMLEAFVLDKAERRELSRHVNSKMKDELLELRSNLDTSSRKIERDRERLEILERTNDIILDIAGFSMYRQDSEEKLKEALAAGMSDGLKQKLIRLINGAKDIEKILGSGV